MSQKIAPALGYAVAVDGKLDSRTMHDHARGAMVNFLWVHGYQMTNQTRDEVIREVFCKVAQEPVRVGAAKVQLVLVRLEPVVPVDPASEPLLKVPVGPG